MRMKLTKLVYAYDPYADMVRAVHIYTPCADDEYGQILVDRDDVDWVKQERTHTGNEWEQAAVPDQKQRRRHQGRESNRRDHALTRVNYVNISGGKDSTATLLLAIERDTQNLRAVFADTGHEHAATYDYLDYLESAVGIKIQRVRARFRRTHGRQA